MKHSRFYTQTINTKGNRVKTGNGHQYAEATLSIEPDKNEESFDSPSVRVRVTEAKDGEMIISLATKVLTGGKFRVIMESGQKPYTAFEGGDLRVSRI